MTMEELLLLVSGVPDVESTTAAVKVNVAADVGVPVIAPLLALNNRPLGSEPEVIEKMYGGVPPPAINAEL
jgi:hypothetical protein